jgi:hypothetical protein
MKSIVVAAVEQCQCDQEVVLSMSITRSRTQTGFIRRKEFERQGEQTSSTREGNNPQGGFSYIT